MWNLWGHIPQCQMLTIRKGKRRSGLPPPSPAQYCITRSMTWFLKRVVGRALGGRWVGGWVGWTGGWVGVVG